MKRSIVWFKNDLRLHDNETLWQAVVQSDEIIPVYCFDEAHFRQTSYGFCKTGFFRAKFLLEALENLNKNLQLLGSGLLVVRGNPENVLFELACSYGVDKIFVKSEVAFEEMVTQKNVEQRLKSVGCMLISFDTHTLFHSADLPFDLFSMPEVFTDFRKKVENHSNVREVVPTPIFIHSPVLDPLTLPKLQDLGFADYLVDTRAVLEFEGGETQGLKRLHDYLFVTHGIATYKETRNGMIGENYSSKFSPWISLGCLSVRKIYHEIKNYEINNIANASTYWLVFELIWRDFFVFMMRKYPSDFFKPGGIKMRKSSPVFHNEKVFDNWRVGATANDFVNANMIELNLTGFMSNRGRQIVASYLCHNLKLDWRYGASYFEQQLIDYDVCSNWCNWAYIAGVGNNPRGASFFDVDKQAYQYDQNKTYRNLWLTKN